MWLLADGATSVTDVLTGGAGWVGTGLLGSVLGWIFFKHLPDKDKQVESLITSRDALVERQAQRVENTLKEQVEFMAKTDRERREDFRAALDVVVNHCRQETSMQRDMISKDMQEVTAAVVDLRGALEELRSTWIEHLRSGKS